MKKYMLGVFAVVLAIGVSSFTNAGKFSLPRFFKYTGSTTLSVAQVTNINNWVEVPSFINVDDSHVIPAEIEIDQNEGTYIYLSGAKQGKLMVDQASTFQSDVELAAGLQPSPNNFVQDVVTADYTIYNNSVKL